MKRKRPMVTDAQLAVLEEFGGRTRDRFDPKKMVADDVAHMVVALLELESRAFVPELNMWATNPWPDA